MTTGQDKESESIPVIFLNRNGDWIMLGEGGEKFEIAMRGSPLERAMTARMPGSLPASSSLAKQEPVAWRYKGDPEQVGWRYSPWPVTAPYVKGPLEPLYAAPLAPSVAGRTYYAHPQQVPQRGEAVNLARNWLDAQKPNGSFWLSEKGIRTLADAVILMDAWILEVTKSAASPAAKAMPDSPTPRTASLLVSVGGDQPWMPDQRKQVIASHSELERELAEMTVAADLTGKLREMERASASSASALKKLPCDYCGAELTPAMLPIHTCPQMDSAIAKNQTWCEHVGGLGPPFPHCKICGDASAAIAPTTERAISELDECVNASLAAVATNPARLKAMQDDCRARIRRLAPSAIAKQEIPAELFDGYAVWKALGDDSGVSQHNVSAVLDAVVRLIRSRP